MSGHTQGSYVFVLIPTDTQKDLKEVTWTGGDSFHKDGLTNYANSHFGKIPEAPLDVTSLDMPRADTGYVGITMYR